MPMKELETFSVSYLSILDEDGNVDKELEPKLKKAELVELYRQMVWARRTDERMLKLQRQGRIGTFGPSTGQEAAQCAVAFAMKKRDWFAGAFRELGVATAARRELTRQLIYYNGLRGGERQRRGGQSAQPPHLGDRGRAAAARRGPGLRHAPARRDRNLRRAGLHGRRRDVRGRLPRGAELRGRLQGAGRLRRARTTSGRSRCRARSRPRRRRIAQKALALRHAGGPGRRQRRAGGLRRGRGSGRTRPRGEGPTLIEAVTYRLSIHTTADDPSGTAPTRRSRPGGSAIRIARFQIYLGDRGSAR